MNKKMHQRLSSNHSTRPSKANKHAIRSEHGRFFQAATGVAVSQGQNSRKFKMLLKMETH